MRTHGSDPIHGCTHGATTDEAIQGLTKREWLFGCALQGMSVFLTPEKAVDWAMNCMELALKKLNQPKAEPVAAEPFVP